MIYLLKLNFALMLLYGFYRLMMTRDTFFGYRRIALWGILAVSLLVPMTNIQWLLEGNATVVGMATVYADYVLPVVPVYAPAPTFTWMDGLMAVYWAGVAALGLRFLFQLGSILRQAYTTPVDTMEGVEVHRLSDNHSPFSFFHWIFVCPGAQSPDQLHEILVHEQAHATQLHSLDVVVAELFCVVNWFNPFCYLMKREIRLNLEYLADEAVLDEGNARKPYQYHLLGLAYHPGKRDLTNNFNVLPLKNRIKMMNKRRTHEIGKAKYLLFIPLAAGLLAVSNIEMIARTLSEDLPVISHLSKQTHRLLNSRMTLQETAPEALTEQQEEQLEVASPDSVAAAEQSVGKVFDVVERMPSFPGGTVKLMQYLAANVKYPAECHKEGIQGRVVVQFVVLKDGSVTDVHIVRGVDPRLDAEAVRVVSSMPHWTPGINKGKPVNVKYNVPISFKLSGGMSVPAIKASSQEDFISAYYPGGQAALMNYLMQNVKYPAEAQKVGAEGVYYAILKVNADGSYDVQDVALSESKGQNIQGKVDVVGYANKDNQASVAEKAEGQAALAKEARRIAHGLSKFNATGKEVMVTIPISFKLQ